MKERPILFSAPMVRAILDGSKSQTRRIIKIQPDIEHDGEPYWFVGGYRAWRYRGVTDILRKGGDEISCPYGQPGDRLWVRETFHTVDGHRAFYRADYNHNPKGDKEHGIVWTPSIHMPRWASRITLEVTGVRVERLQDISEAGAMAEGSQWSACGAPQDGSYKAGYAQLWESINGAGSWPANPWVWVIEFKVME